jgi:hypothetical protein
MRRLLARPVKDREDFFEAMAVGAIATPLRGIAARKQFDCETLTAAFFAGADDLWTLSGQPPGDFKSDPDIDFIDLELGAALALAKAASEDAQHDDDRNP